MPKIMLIDDDLTMVRLLRTLLEMDGYEIVDTHDWPGIIDAIREEQPDLIVMDYFLPNVDGLDLVKRIRAAENLGQIRVIMTSGMDVSDQCLEAGVDAFLLKPFTPDVLLSTIQEHLGQEDRE
jgi:CheY-like chemotaxis protein